MLRLYILKIPTKIKNCPKGDSNPQAEAHEPQSCVYTKFHHLGIIDSSPTSRRHPDESGRYTKFHHLGKRRNVTEVTLPYRDFCKKFKVIILSIDILLYLFFQKYLWISVMLIQSYLDSPSFLLILLLKYLW